MNTNYEAWVAKAAKQPVVLETVDLGTLGAEDVEVAVEHCGLCHSDLSILNNDWGISQYPAILGHEVVGHVTAVGPNAKALKIGQRVGVGWYSASCMHCHQCMSGSHHLCPQVQPTIVGHRGGFATHIRSHWAWTVPLPESIELESQADVSGIDDATFQKYAGGAGMLCCFLPGEITYPHLAGP